MDELLPLQAGGLRAIWRERRPGPGGLKAWSVQAWRQAQGTEPITVLTAAPAGSHQLAALVRLSPPDQEIWALLHPEPDHPRRRLHLQLAAPGLRRVEILPDWTALDEARRRRLADPAPHPLRWLPPGGTLEAALEGLREPARAIARRAREIDADRLVLPTASGRLAASLAALLAAHGLDLPLHAVSRSPRRALHTQGLDALLEEARRRLRLRARPRLTLHRPPSRLPPAPPGLDLEPIYGESAYAWATQLPDSARALLIQTHERDLPRPAAPLPPELERALRPAVFD